MNTSEKIKKIMKEKSINQSELAKIINVDQGFISRLLSGKQKKTTKLIDIASALNCSVYSLLDNDQSENFIPTSTNNGTECFYSITESNIDEQIKLSFFTEEDMLNDFKSLKKVNFSKNILKSYHKKKKNIFIFNIKCKNMNPTMNDKTMSAIDTSDINITDGSIYLIKINNFYKVVRLYIIK